MKDSTKEGQVINFDEARKARIEERRRKYERVLFKHVLGAYGVAEGEGLKAVELVDLSTEGLSFQLPHGSKNLGAVKAGHEMVFRIYFSEQSYIPIGVKIQNQRPYIEEGCAYERFGCAVDKTMQSYETYRLFVEFLRKYAETAHQDSGDMKIFFF